MAKESSPWKTDEIMVQQAAVEDVAAEALAFSFNPGRAFRLLKIIVKLSGPVVATEDLTVNHNSKHGAKFDSQLSSQAMNGLSEKVFDYTSAMEYYEAGDAMDIAFTNTDALNWGCLVIYQEKV